MLRCCLIYLIFIILITFAYEDDDYYSYDDQLYYGEDENYYYYYYADDDNITEYESIQQNSIPEAIIETIIIDEQEIYYEDVYEEDGMNNQNDPKIDYFFNRLQSDISSDNDDLYYGDEELNPSKINPPSSNSIKKHGFQKNLGGGMKRISSLIISGKFMEETSFQFNCFLKKNSGPQKVPDPNYKPPPKESPQNKTSGTGSGNTVKKATPRELELIRLKAKEEEEKRMKIKYPLGSDCESLVCAACKITVEEFGHAILGVIDDPRYQFIYDVTEDFCDNIIALSYSPLVVHICNLLMNEEKGYREALVKPFEEDPNIEHSMSASSLYTKKKNICLAVGACTLSQYDFITEPETRLQEQWQEECYLCQAVVKDIEEKVCSTRGLTDLKSAKIVAEACDRISLAPNFDKQCRKMLSRSTIEDIAWMSKIHYEAVNKHELGTMKFPDTVCENIVLEDKAVKYCEKWIDPAELKRKSIEESIEAVFY